MKGVLCRTAAASLERRAFIGVARPPRTSPKLTPATRRIALSHTVRIRPFSTNLHQSSGPTPGALLALTARLSLAGFMVLLAIPDSTYYWGFDRVVLPVVRVLGGREVAHGFVRWAMAKGWLPKLHTYWPRLDECKSEAEGVHVIKKSWRPHLGVAAAMDPEGNALQGLSHLGLSFVEIGPITFKPQDGDIMAHRKALVVGDRAPVDRYVVPSHGAVKTYCQLKKWKYGSKDAVLFVHVAPNDDSDDPAEDIRRGMDWLVDVADFFVVSFPSSILHLPRDKSMEAMKRFCTDIGAKAENTSLPWYERDTSKPPKPLLLKLHPDLSSEQLHDIASVALGHDVSGLIVCGNVCAKVVPAGGDETHEAAAGGKSFKEVSTRMVREMYALTEGKLPIIASGAVANAEDAYEKIRAGASLVQVGQALLVDHGLGSVFKLREGLIDLAHADCHKKLEHVIGADHKKRSPKEIEQA